MTHGLLLLVFYGYALYSFGQGFNLLPIKKSEELDVQELALKKKIIVVRGVAFLGLGVIYIFEVLGIW